MSKKNVYVYKYSPIRYNGDANNYERKEVKGTMKYTLAELRNAHNYSLEFIADKCSTDIETVQYYEDNPGETPFNMIVDLLTLYDRSIYDIDWSIKIKRIAG